ncbi:hypothetical protein NDU88_004938 [Pleurodeles waltl]|uniref:Uncharacterized protein n=1 Tax=Pleurodeles waltl TaxID=8319 RepID=A0AAV7WZQ9_PLEWA|nr:hypothetical protein NDU88_004938 [Pleurodeles waltl]
MPDRHNVGDRCSYKACRQALNVGQKSAPYLQQATGMLTLSVNGIAYELRAGNQLLFYMWLKVEREKGLQQS